jgi:N-glycosylase/DNA lyase
MLCYTLSCEEVTAADGCAFTLPESVEFSPDATFGCGQCFRFAQKEPGVWQGAAKGKILTVSGRVLRCAEGEYRALWRDYLDADTDYAAIRAAVAVTPFMSEAADYGRGLRILRQDFWETLCSFIISQRNNIPRIAASVAKLCGGALRPFPPPSAVAAMGADALRGMGLGYRAEYVLLAAREVAEGRITGQSPLRDLLALRGIGPKVASCVELFSMGRFGAFPRDVWVNRALGRYFPPGFCPEQAFGPFGGYAQQYIYHYIRHLEGKRRPPTTNR